MPTLLTVPNVSEGTQRETIDAIGSAFQGGGARLLDVHSDRDHERSVYSLAAPPIVLAEALLAGARVAVERIDIRDGRGVHPHVGALDVAPIVYLDEPTRGAALAEALVVADRIGEELAVPVFLYGAIAGARARAELRRGGAQELARRVAAGELVPDFGPHTIHPSAGATLVAAREPLVAFNLELCPPASAADARRIAALVREGGQEGLPGLRAIGVALAPSREPAARARAQDAAASGAPAGAEPVAQVRSHAPVARAEIVGLAPRAALEGFPDELPIVGFDPARQLIENVLTRD